MTLITNKNLLKVLTFEIYIYIIVKGNRRKSRMWLPPIHKEEVVLMVEKYILQLMILSIYFNVLQAILAIALIIALAIKLIK